MIINDIAWFKPNASPNLSGRLFTASHETLIWAKKSKASRQTFNYEKTKADPGHTSETWKKPGRQMRSVWGIPPPPASEKTAGRHPTQKPLRLLSRIIEASSNPGDLILDPFLGSGTTAVAALSLGRRFIGCDNNRDYIDLAKARLQELERSASNPQA